MSRVRLCGWARSVKRSNPWPWGIRNRREARDFRTEALTGVVALATGVAVPRRASTPTPSFFILLSKTSFRHSLSLVHFASTREWLNRPMTDVHAEWPSAFCHSLLLFHDRPLFRLRSPLQHTGKIIIMLREFHRYEPISFDPLFHGKVNGLFKKKKKKKKKSWLIPRQVGEFHLIV